MLSMNICVYCSSSDHIKREYFNVAREMGTLIAQRGDTLIWGGGRVGLMGEVARAVHANGGRVVGVIPHALSHVEIAYDNADELIVTETMRERKHIMDERSDAFVILPGGFGTLEELAEILVLRILQYHDRPIVLLNYMGFYDKFVALCEHFVEEKFAKAKYLAMLEVVSTAEQVYAFLESLPDFELPGQVEDPRETEA